MLSRRARGGRGDGPRVVLINNMVTPYTAKLLNTLAENVDFSVISCSAQEANRQWKDDLRISFRHLVLRGFSIKLSSSRYAHVNRGVHAAIVAARPSLLIINGFFPTMFAAAVIARLRRIPFLIQVDGWKETMPVTPYHAVVRRLMIAWSAGAIVCSEKGARFFEESGLARDKIHVARLVPAWPAPPAVRPFAERPYALLWLAQLNDDVKNAAFFVAFARALHARIGAFRVRVVGSGPAKESMLDGLREIPLEVDYTAYVPWREIEPVFSSARLMALPSLWEPWALVCNEAMQCGTPCIVSGHVGAAGELVTERNGFVEPLYAEGWADAAAAVLAAPPAWEQRSVAAREAAARFSFDDYLAAHLRAIGDAAR